LSAAARARRPSTDEEIVSESSLKAPRSGAKRTLMSTMRQIPNFLRLLYGLMTDRRVEPVDKLFVAGAILYSQYGVFERILMRLIMRRKGHGDVKWDQEYTDWEAVAAFAKDFAAAVAGHAARRPGEGQADGVTRRRFR